MDEERLRPIGFSKPQEILLPECRFRPDMD
jgi:hypothetical protein